MRRSGAELSGPGHSGQNVHPLAVQIVVLELRPIRSGSPRRELYLLRKESSKRAGSRERPRCWDHSAQALHFW